MTQEQATIFVWATAAVLGGCCAVLWFIGFKRAWSMPTPVARFEPPPFYIESERRDDYADPPNIEMRPCGQCLMFMPDNPAHPDAEQWGKCAVRKISVTRRMHVVLKIGEPTCFTTEATIMPDWNGYSPMVDPNP